MEPFLTRGLLNTLNNKISPNKQPNLLGITLMYYLKIIQSPILPNIITHQKPLTRPKTHKDMDKHRL